MTTTPSTEPALTVAASATPSPSLKNYDFDFSGTNYEFDVSVSEEERRFYLKIYPTVDMINQRKVHCTVCRIHIGTAVSTENNIKMHPILRVTHCIKCHDFYNSGEFSKGEDGSELYCRWCGQGGEVYCCSSCPFVFCKSCIIKNLSRGVISDIEQNENWNCFKCTSKILWPLRAQHWALVNYIETQKTGLQSLQLSELEMRSQMHKDYTTCCRLAKAKVNSLSDSMESLESNASKRSQASSVQSVKRSLKPQGPAAKRPKSSNDEVVCTPDLLSMLEPDCQISVTPKPSPRPNITATTAITTTPRIFTVQQNYTGPSPATNGTVRAGPRSSLPPPLVLSSSGMRYRQSAPNQATVVRRTVVPNAVRSAGPVFHTINGFRVDLNSAAQQDSYRLPNGRLIQVKRQLPPSSQPTTTITRAPVQVTPQVIIRQQQPGGSSQRMLHPGFGSNMGIYNPQTNQQQRAPQVVRVNNSSQVQAVNVPPQTTPISSNGGPAIMMTPAPATKGPTLVRHVFANNPLGNARTQLQNQIFSAMEICTHLTNKVQTLTLSNAYNEARSQLDVKELYIHLSYLMTYAIGRFKQLQDKCLLDMREMGFKNEANSLENGQLAAAVDYVCYGQLDDVDLFNTGTDSFHNQVYEYRKSLHANLKNGENLDPLPPIFKLSERGENDLKDEDEGQQENETTDNDNDEIYDLDDDQDDDLDDGDDIDDLDDEYDALGTEESMNRNEQAHAYDRKLTRLLREYPSIWCTRHPDYGKMEVTRKQWRVIATHFPRGDDIKLRWKNIRKRYVRIERLLKQGKRFKGYFDKATNYLANRDLPRKEWLPVDCGEGDGDSFERKQLDALENSINKGQQNFGDVRQPVKTTSRVVIRPIEVRPIDLRIINFAKSHPVLWRKSTDPEFNSIDEQTRKSLWLNFWKSAPKKQASDDEDNEIEIVEPKTDTITIDSDNEEESPSPIKMNVCKGLKITSVKSTAPGADSNKDDAVSPNAESGGDSYDISALSTSILASLLEVDITDADVKAGQSTSLGGSAQKKQPRKKLTKKPNPALLQLERQRMEEMKRNDAKLKMKVVVKLTRAEEEFEVARKWMEEHLKNPPNRAVSDTETSSDVLTMDCATTQPETDRQKERLESEETIVHGEETKTNSDKKKTQNTEESMQHEKEQEQEVPIVAYEKMDTGKETKSQTGSVNSEEEGKSSKKKERAEIIELETNANEETIRKSEESVKTVEVSEKNLQNEEFSNVKATEVENSKNNENEMETEEAPATEIESEVCKDVAEVTSHDMRKEDRSEDAQKLVDKASGFSKTDTAATSAQTTVDSIATPSDTATVLTARSSSPSAVAENPDIGCSTLGDELGSPLGLQYNFCD